MTLKEKFSGVAMNLGQIAEFIERAKTLGYHDKTLVGHPGRGLKLFIDESAMPSTVYCSGDGCSKVFPAEEQLFHLTSEKWAVPSHTGPRGYNCSGAGKPGVKSK